MCRVVSSADQECYAPESVLKGGLNERKECGWGALLKKVSGDRKVILGDFYKMVSLVHTVTFQKDSIESNIPNRIGI